MSFQSNRSAGPRQLLLPEANPLFPAPGCCTWLPSQYCSLIAFQRPLFELLFALENQHPAISTELFFLLRT